MVLRSGYRFAGLDYTNERRPLRLNDEATLLDDLGAVDVGPGYVTNVEILLDAFGEHMPPTDRLLPHLSEVLAMHATTVGNRPKPDRTVVYVVHGEVLFKLIRWSVRGVRCAGTGGGGIHRAPTATRDTIVALRVVMVDVVLKLVQYAHPNLCLYDATEGWLPTLRRTMYMHSVYNKSLNGLHVVRTADDVFVGRGRWLLLCTSADGAWQWLAAPKLHSMWGIVLSRVPPPEHADDPLLPDGYFNLPPNFNVLDDLIFRLRALQNTKLIVASDFSLTASHTVLNHVKNGMACVRGAHGLALRANVQWFRAPEVAPYRSQLEWYMERPMYNAEITAGPVAFLHGLVDVQVCAEEIAAAAAT